MRSQAQCKHSCTMVWHVLCFGDSVLSSSISIVLECDVGTVCVALWRHVLKSACEAPQSL